MKNAIALLFCFAGSLNLLAQKPRAEIHLKLNVDNALFGGISVPAFDLETNKSIDFVSPSIGLSFLQENGKFTEFGLGSFTIKAPYNDSTDTRVSVGAWFAKGKVLTKNRNAWPKVVVGGLFRAIRSKEQLNALNPLGVALERNYYTGTLAIFSNLDFKIHQRLHFEISPFLDVANFTARLEYLYDNSLDPEAADSVDFYFLPFQPFLRIGLAYRM